MKKLTTTIAAVLLFAPLAGWSQTTVFSDNFASSTLSPTAASPGITGTNRTAYEIASTKSITPTIAGNSLSIPFSTSSAYGEAQALFTTNAPITLTTGGAYIELYYTFTDSPTMFSGNAGAQEQLIIGLYNSGGSGPTNGTLLNNGLASGSTTAVNGGTKNWLGYSATLSYNTNISTANVYASSINTRVAQTGANNLNQGLGFSAGYTLNTAGSQIVSYPGVSNAPALTIGNHYTVALQITYVNSTTLAITNTLYNGAGIGGSVVNVGGFNANFGGTATGANVLTTTFDGFVVGFRPTSSPTTAETLQITNITVLKFIPTAPAISGLASRQTFISGTTNTITPTVTGQPAPTYQWYVSTDGGVTSNSLAWATSASLTLTNVQYSQNNYIYTLVAANNVGTNASSTTLSVIVPPTISSLVNQSQNVGDSFSISPTVSGVPTPAEQWVHAGTNLLDGATGNGSTVSGTATATLSFVNGQATDSGYYYLIATNLAGYVTNSMYLTVSSTPTLPALTGPTNITVIQGNNGTFSSTASGLPVPTLQWLDQNGNPIAGATSSSLTLTNVQYSQNGYTYSLIASNSVGSVTNTATLFVIVPPTITSQPASLTVTNSQSAAFTVAATGVPTPTYQWYFNSSAISSSLNNTATNATLIISTTSTASAGNYYVVISNSAGSTNSATVTLAINSAMAVAALAPANSATNICYDTPLYLTFSAPPNLTTNGTIKIFNVTNSVTPVDTINLSLSVTLNANAPKIQPRSIAGETFTNYPVIITGNQAAIYPHLNLLTSNQTYYVTVDNGTFVDSAGANFAGITATNSWQFSTKTAGPANATNILVSADGTGDFVTVQGAVDFVPSGNTTPTLITINTGNYVEIVDIKSKHNITLRGQSRNGTIVGYANNANLQGSTHYRMAMKINGNNIALDNLTVTNRTPVGGSQAEALMLESNVRNFIFNNCNLGSYQDTLLANGSSGAVAYFNNDLIEGNFDYIWGGGVLFFTNCEIRTLLGNGGSTTGGNVTASRTDTSAGAPWAGYNGLSASNGIAFVNCRFTRATNTISSTALADSNGTSNGVVAWINCSFDANYIVPSTAVLNSQLLWEYGNSNLTDTAAVTFGLAVGDSAPALTTGDARYIAAANSANWLYGWTPQLTPNILTNPISQTVSNSFPATFTVVATGIPNPTYQWQHAGTNLSSATSPTLTIASAGSADAGAYDVIVTTSAGSVTSASATLTVTAPAYTPPVFTAPLSGTNINVGFSLAISCTATDANNGTLTYTLLAGPGGSTLNSSNGNFTWRPATSAANSSNTVQVAVIDGTSSLSATNLFTVRVNALTSPSATSGSATYSGGVFSVSAGGQVGPDYYLQATTNLTGGSWTTVASTNSPASLPVILSDPNAGLQPQQFYRIVNGPPAP